MKKYRFPIVWILVLLTWTACDPDHFEDKFDRSANERLNAAKAELYESLTAGGGTFSCAYFFQPEQLGATHFVFKFNKDYSVVLTCDGEGLSGRDTISYQLLNTQRITLSFENFSVLHMYADPDQPGQGIQSAGFGGDFEFLLDSIGKEQIFFTGKRHATRLTLTREAGFEEGMDLFRVAAEQMEQLINLACEEPSLDWKIGLVEVTNKQTGQKNQFQFSFHKLAKKATFVYIENETLTRRRYGVAFDGEGFEISTPLEIAGGSFTRFEWNAAKQSYSIDSPTLTGEMSFRKNMLPPVSEALDLEGENFSGDLNSPKAQALLDAIVEIAGTSKARFDLAFRLSLDGVIYNEARVVFLETDEETGKEVYAGHIAYQIGQCTVNNDGSLTIEPADPLIATDDPDMAELAQMFYEEVPEVKEYLERIFSPRGWYVYSQYSYIAMDYIYYLVEKEDPDFYMRGSL